LRPELTRLCNKLGNKYGGNGVTTFGVPNLMNRYVKYGPLESVGVVEDGHIGEHTHTATATPKGEHWHSLHAGQTGTTNTGGDTSHDKYKKGSIVITGSFRTKNDDEPFTNADGVKSQTGALKLVGKSSKGGASTSSGGGFLGLDFNTANKNSWSGQMQITGTHTHPITVNKAGSGTNDVDHIIMVPIIRY
jgi:microcystin-dependent protein